VTAAAVAAQTAGKGRAGEAADRLISEFTPDAS